MRLSDVARAYLALASERLLPNTATPLPPFAPVELVAFVATVTDGCVGNAGAGSAGLKELSPPKYLFPNCTASDTLALDTSRISSTSTASEKSTTLSGLVTA